MIFQGWFPWRLTGLISLLSKGFSRVFPSTTDWRHQFLVLCLFHGPTLTTVCDEQRPWPWLMHLSWRGDVFAFQQTVEACHGFPAKKQLSSDFMAAVTMHRDFRAPEEEICHCFHLFPLYFPWSDGTGCYDLSLIFSFKSAFSFSSFTLIKRFSSFSLLSAIRWGYHLHIWGCWCFSPANLDTIL